MDLKSIVLHKKKTEGSYYMISLYNILKKDERIGKEFSSVVARVGGWEDVAE